MILKPNTKLTDLLDAYPFLEEYLPTVNSKFSLLNNKVARNTIGRFATLEKIAMVGGTPLEFIMKNIASKIEKETGETTTYDTGKGEKEKTKAEMKATIKTILLDLHQGEEMEAAKAKFEKLAQDITPSDIAEIEQELMDNEGVTSDDIKKLCDIHVKVMESSIEKGDLPEVPEGHPLDNYLKENRKAETFIYSLTKLIGKLENGTYTEDDTENIKLLINKFRKIDNHYTRKENQLFPVFEEKDFTGPSKVMWALHDDIRALFKQAVGMLNDNEVVEAATTIKAVCHTVKDMIYKEEKIMFPAAFDMFDENDWRKVQSGESEIGFSWIVPGQYYDDLPANEKSTLESGIINLDTGKIQLSILNKILKNLPVDITFVNAQDEVVYYSDNAERVFPRSPGVIGRKVQNCHPPKSMHIVQNILDAFRNGDKNEAEFWIQLGDKFLHIRYYAIREDNGTFLGTLEVTQDVTGIRALKGEQRLLNWEES